eukprot:Nk52_evm5s273 gene=Nk52_evmTU5s273
MERTTDRLFPTNSRGSNVSSTTASGRGDEASIPQPVFVKRKPRLSTDSGVVEEDDALQHPLQNKYELAVSIEKGKYGLVEDKETGMLYFLKIILKNDETVTSSVMLLKRDECQLTSRLTHPYISSPKDSMETQGSLYLVYEYIPESLHTSLTDWSSSQICSLFSSLVSGITFIEQEGMSHTGLCPSKVLVHKDYTVKICGISHVVQSLICMNESSRDCQFNCCFEAPEARERGCTYSGPEAHVYSLACILYYIMNAKKVPPASGMQEHLETILRCQINMPPFRKNLYKLMISMCSENPLERISTTGLKEKFERHMECFF